MKSLLKLILVISTILLGIKSELITLKYLIILFASWVLITFVLKLRHDFSSLPLYLLTKIQRRNFKISIDINEIKKILKLKDKGMMIEELFATPAWEPILSVESVNGDIWEVLKKNLLEFVEYLPSKEKLGIIAKEEANYLIQKRMILDSKLISKITLKIFLKWIFSENHIELIIHKINQIDNSNNHKINLNKVNSQNVNPENNNYNNETEPFFNKRIIDSKDNNRNENNFIEKFLSDEFLENMYLASIEYRKEIALKGLGCKIKKQYAVDAIIEILQKSKYGKLCNWKKPECYSFIMQPFIISPMINISDIAVSLFNNHKKFLDENFKNNFFAYLDHCLFSEHPFPILERYDKESNIQYFVDLRSLKNFVDEKEGNVINFGVGIRSCLGRFYAKELIQNFFEDFLKNKNNAFELFNPKLGHILSGRDNDQGNFQESFYQIKLLIKVLISEIWRNFFKKN